MDTKRTSMRLRIHSSERSTTPSCTRFTARRQMRPEAATVQQSAWEFKIAIVNGDPVRKHISTSYVERQNLTMRMQMRRFTRLTNGFSKKIQNHAAAIALHFMYYNFARVHQTLRVLHQQWQRESVTMFGRLKRSSACWMQSKSR